MKHKKLYFLALMLLTTAAMQAQDMIVLRGRVTAKGKGVPYATLQLQGTSTGVSCNDNGDYELKLPADCQDDTIIVRSMGYIGFKAAVTQLQKNGNVHLKSQAIELKTVVVAGYRSPRHLLSDVVKRIGSNYQQHTAWSTFFYRDWRSIDDELYLFDEAVMKVRRCPYSQYANKRGYSLDPSQREMESNFKTLLRHRLLVYDRQLLKSKIIKSRGCDQMLAYADDEYFFDPVATPQASYALAVRLLKEHSFEPLKEFSSDGENYYFIRSVGPCRTPKDRVCYEYTIRKSDLALVRLVTTKQSVRHKAPQDPWVNVYFTSMYVEADSSVWNYDVREGHYTLTRYYNAKSYRLESKDRGHDGEVQRWQQCRDWVITDFSLTQPDTKEQPIAVTPQTLVGAFGGSDYSSDFWGQYNYIPIDNLPLNLLNKKFNKQ